ncbi:hypothetical protein [Helicobacter cappadocius]|uniref:Uncharacterized protein n=1 Tax=Helicobacter cappadocius TaxID=3063998 RepID=A0AA90PSL2_9HELI|nr:MULTISPECIES: hypothetical protein [unclassified Helicobacter]MDO7253470.1 hypothetical protein [Helicobacter sp. faydin-H75]MDP2539397.1 hypothetical protein [Helicobacter sp. faydin-H76]
MNFTFKNPISSRLSAIVGITFVVVLIVMILNIYLNKANISLTRVLSNLSLQINLTQSITKDIFLGNYQNTNDFETLNQKSSDFEEKFNTLYYQDRTYKMFWLDEKYIKKILEQMQEQLQKFNSNVRTYEFARKNLYKNRNFLYSNNEKLLDISDDVVKKMIGAKISQEEINEAGKQRTLSQKIPYQLTLYTIKNQKDAYEEFLKSFEKYNSTILGFYTNPTYKGNKELLKAIKFNYDFWQKYAFNVREIIANHNILSDSLSEINDNGILLTQNLKKLYSIYDKTLSQTEYLFNIFQYIATMIVLFVIFGLIFTTIWTKKQITNFLKYSKNLNENSLINLPIREDTELAQASRNINDFISRIQKTKESSILAKKIGEQIHNDIMEINSDIKEYLDEKKFSQEDREKIRKEIGISEYIAIQSSDELINIAKKLDKLSDSIDKSIDIYTNCLTCKKNSELF